MALGDQGYVVREAAHGAAGPPGGAAMKVYDASAETLRREGAEYLFVYPTPALIESATRAGLRPMLCRQERVGVHIADGYARVSNGAKPTVFAMQYGPG